MTYNDIFQSLVRIIKANCESSKADILSNTPLSDCIRNSVELIKVIVDVEEDYNIHFENEELDIQKFQTISDFVQYIERKITEIGSSDQPNDI